jgi:thioredoxin reductase
MNGGVEHFPESIIEVDDRDCLVSKSGDCNKKLTVIGTGDSKSGPSLETKYLLSVSFHCKYCDRSWRKQRDLN